MKNKVVELFKMEVRKYSSAINEDYHSREGDDSVREPYRQRIVKLFEKIPEKIKPNAYFSFLYT